MANDPANAVTIDGLDHWPHVIPQATEVSAGVMSAADKLKLDQISPGGGGAVAYPTFANFPAPATVPGAFAIDSSTGALYCSFGGSWCIITILVP